MVKSRRKGQQIYIIYFNNSIRSVVLMFVRWICYVFFEFLSLSFFFFLAYVCAFLYALKSALGYLEARHQLMTQTLSMNRKTRFKFHYYVRSVWVFWFRFIIFCLRCLSFSYFFWTFPYIFPYYSFDLIVWPVRNNFEIVCRVQKNTVLKPTLLREIGWIFARKN